MPFQIQFVFTSGGQGWTEQWYGNASSISGMVTQISSQVDIASCMAFRGPQTILKSIAVRDSSLNRSGVILPYNRLGTGAVSTTEGSDVTSTAAIYVVNASSTGARRRVWFRGLADLYVGRNPTSGYDAPDARLTSNASAFIDSLRKAGFAIRQLAPLTPGQYEQVAGVCRNPAQPSTTLVFTPTPSLITSGSRVILLGMDRKVAPALTGHYTAYNQVNITIGATPYSVWTVKYNPPRSWPTPTTPLSSTDIIQMPKGRVRQETYAYPAITSWAFNNYWEHKTGKAVGLHRGAARVSVRKAQ